MKECFALCDNNSERLLIRSTGHKKNREAALFVRLAVLTGLILILLTPPMCTPDENAHFLNAYAISQGRFFPEVINNTPGKYIENRVMTFVQDYLQRFVGNLSDKYSFAEQYFNSYLDTPNTELVFYGSSLITANPIAYLPSSIAMGIATLNSNLLRSPTVQQPYNLLFFGRVGNLVFYIAVIYAALRIAPSYRRLMLVLSMMPMSLMLGSSVNYDAILIPISFLLMAEILKLMSEGTDIPIKSRDLACVLFCTFFLVAIKQVYALLLALLLAVPKKKYGSTKRMIGCIAAVLGMGILAYTPQIIINYITKNVVNDSALVVQAQTNFVKTHLTQMPALLFNTIKSFRAYYLESFWGKLGQLDINFPLPFRGLFYSCLLFVSIIEMLSFSPWDRQWKRVLPFSVVVIALFGIFGVMYIQWTPLPGIADGVGSSFVSGVQGRYFIELFLPGVMFLSFRRFADSKQLKKISAGASHIAETCAVLCSVLTPLIIFLRYW